jgi:DNA-binding MarR family transcriptional regulator
MRYSGEQLSKGYSAYAYLRGLNFSIENNIKQIIKNKELTFPGFRILWILYFDSNIRMSDLTYLAQANISNIFRQLVKLQEAGVVIIENGEDARTKEIALTEEGRQLVQDFIEQQSKKPDIHIVQMIENIPKEDYLTFIKVASLLSTELIGATFTDFVTKSSSEIASGFTPK